MKSLITKPGPADRAIARPDNHDAQDANADDVQLKRDLAGKSYGAQVQLLAPGAASAGAADVHEAARSGVQGSGQQLPHLDTIQRAFGHHDVSGIKAHVGGSAAEASERLGAQGYAIGSDVAFPAAPSLHTAAHEATHYLQQQKGVSLKGGVGSAGDRYEQEAGTVADTVAAGRSAEGMLDGMVGSSGGAPSAAVQRKPKSDAEGEGAAEGEAGAAEEMSEGDRLRAAVSGTAEELEGEEFMSQDEIDDVRERTGMKNYTTCIDFAGKTMRGAVGKAYGKDYKKAQQTAVMLTEIKGNWDKEVGALAQAANYAKAVTNFDKAIAKVEARKAKMAAKIEKLRGPAKEGEAEWAFKARHKQADILERKALGAFDRAIRKLEKQRDRFQNKVDNKQAQAEELAANNTAMIKSDNGMTNGRPKQGEYIILAQVPKGGSYGVSKDTQVNLAGGTFKHIAVHMEHADIGNGVEKWTTIDGGGTKGKQTVLYIRTADRLVYYTPDIKVPEPGKPWTGTRAVYQLAGWIDMDQLIAMRDRKAADGG